MSKFAKTRLSPQIYSNKQTDIIIYFLLVEAKANSPPPSEASPVKDQGHRAKELQKGA